MSEIVAVPPALLRRLWFAVWSAVAFLAVTAVLGLLRDGYDSWHQAVSALSLGPGGWIQAINLVMFGAVVASTAPAWRRILAGGTGATSFPVLIALVGASFIAVGLIPQDPAPGYDPAGLALEARTPGGVAHLSIAGVAAVASIASLFVMAVRFKREPAWASWATRSRLAAVALVACVTVFGVWSTRSSGFAGTFERLVIVIQVVWTAALLRRLHAGAPFMIAIRQA